MAAKKIITHATDQVIHIRVPEEVHRALRIEAGSRDPELGTLTQVVNEALEIYLKKIGRLK